ncbi:MAG: DUF5615 family PIN-like protein [Candidatus Saccharimonas sp.]|nr:DUF5615 family PIN-like protein [Planctomycetaceae bacterium]
MLKAYADENVIAPLVEALRRRGMDVITVQERGRREADDAELLGEALLDERLMLTNDTDFLAIAADRASRSESFAPIVYWPQQQRRIGDLVQSLIALASNRDYSELLGRVVFL